MGASDSENTGQAKTIDLYGKRVVVTGANGFIGRRLVAGLIKAKASVTVLLRSAHGKARFEGMGVTVIICKLVEGDALVQALSGQNILFHFAYDVRASGSDNLMAFNALLSAAQQSGVGRIIHASSAVVYDNWPDGALSETSTTSTATGGDYRQAKIAMETALIAGNMPAAILQPTIVYGPGSPLWTLAPQAMLRKGPVILPDPVGTCPAVYVEDVVETAVLAGALPDLAQERFLINGPDIPSWADFFRAHADLIHTGTIQMVPLKELEARLPSEEDPSASSGPSAAARISGVSRAIVGSRRFDQIIARLQRFAGVKGATLPSRSQLRLYAANPTVSTAYACKRLGYDPRFDLRTGMATIANSK